MYVAGIDPGQTIGVALIQGATPHRAKVLESFEISHEEIDIYRLFWRWYREMTELDPAETLNCVVEDFVGAGPRSKPSNDTLKVIGGVIFTCRALKIPCTAVQPQVRLSYVAQVSTMTTGRDAISALAHAYSHLGRICSRGNAKR